MSRAPEPQLNQRDAGPVRPPPPRGLPISCVRTRPRQCNATTWTKPGSDPGPRTQCSTTSSSVRPPRAGNCDPGIRCAVRPSRSGKFRGTLSVHGQGRPTISTHMCHRGGTFSLRCHYSQWLYVSISPTTPATWRPTPSSLQRSQHQTQA